MIFHLPTLQYSFDSMEPFIDKTTMEIHYGKHHATYVSNLNVLLEGKSELENISLDDLLGDIAKIPEDIRQGIINNGGGHANHSFFWSILGNPNSVSKTPSGDLKNAIETSFGSLDSLKEKMKDAGLKRFGSGWAWLVLSANNLEILSTANQDSPLMLNNLPVIGIDVWEHAYYLNYQNRRADYIDAIWNILDWNMVSDIFAKNSSTNSK